MISEVFSGTGRGGGEFTDVHRLSRKYPVGSLGRKLLIDGSASAVSAISSNGGEPETERRLQLSFVS